MNTDKGAEQNPSHPGTEHDATVVLSDVPGGQGGSPMEKLLAEAQQKAEENWNAYLRVVAELDNMRKRAQRDVEQAHLYGLEKFAQELLDVRDTLELGLQQASAGGDLSSLIAGKEATLKLLSKAFEKFKIKEINPLGAPFDPKFHEAMALQPSATAEPNSVLQVVQKGYELNGRLLRPARVLVAKAPDA